MHTGRYVVQIDYDTDNLSENFLSLSGKARVHLKRSQGTYVDVLRTILQNFISNAVNYVIGNNVTPSAEVRQRYPKLQKEQI